MIKETMDKNPIPTSQNPLMKYFRQPAIYIKLPSGGNFWAPGSLDLPVTGEIPVYPMTARDEITLRTPDALMNGSSMVEVMQSCCPNINDGWKMPSIDVDAVLIGIRIASYGAEMNVDTDCPKCKHDNRHTADLTQILGTITAPDYSEKVQVNDLKIKLQPQVFFSMNRQNMIKFEEDKIAEAMDSADMRPEDKAAQISQSLSKLVGISIDAVTDSTSYIETSDGNTVSDSNYIREFYASSDAGVLRAVQSVLSKINAQMDLDPLPVRCDNCKEIYNVPLEFDYANFFAGGS